MSDTEKTPQRPAKHTPGPLSLRVRSTVDRLGLSDPQGAEYFGVPLFTVRKWVTGEREPGAVVGRLLDVLALMETVCPDVHASLLPSVGKHVGKRRTSVSQLAPEPRHVGQSDVNESSGSTQN